MRSWRVAMGDALYGPTGFYIAGSGPAAHFHTSTQQPLFAAAIATLLLRCDLRRVVDVGAGGGELLTQLHRLDPTLGLHGVDVAGRPPGLPAAIGWSARIPPLVNTLVIANEWLDNVPVEIVESTVDGPRTVLVDDTGVEALGARPQPADLAWLQRWWRQPFRRAEVGRSRDEAWADLVGAARDCVLVAVDYAHSAGTRPADGSLAAYRRGRQVRPVPDGSCDLTAHVALDACAAAGVVAGASPALLLDQRSALAALGISDSSTAAGSTADKQLTYAGLGPDTDRSTADPRNAPLGLGRHDSRHPVDRRDTYDRLRAADRATAAAELTDPAGLGRFGWLIQSVGRPGVLL